MSPLYWERHPDGQFVTLIAVATNYLHPENYDLDALKALARREDDEQMRVFKSELRDALRDPGQLPGDELSESVQYDNGSGEAFLCWLWHELYGDEPFDADIITRLKALPEPFADRLCWVDWRACFDVGKAARAGEWGNALDALLAGLVKGGVPVSAAEREELAVLLKATGQPAGAVVRLSVARAGALRRRRYGDDAGGVA